MAHGNHNGHGDHGGKKKGNSQLKHLLSFLDVGKPLQGKDLYKAAKAEAKIQTKPQVDAYKRLAKQLKAQEKFDTKGLKRLGQKSSTAVGNVYDNLGKYSKASAAQTAAAGNQLVQQTNQAGAAYGQQLGQSQSTQLAGFLSSNQRAGGTGTSTAQQQLAQIVANQQSQAQNDQRAASALAASQAGSSNQLARAMGTSAQLQGATAQAGIRSSIISRVGAEKLQAQQDISEARGKAADARALKGSTLVQALQNLRGQEQQFKLGKAATAQRAAAAQLSAQTSIANSKRTAASAAASRKQDQQQFDQTHTPTGRPKGSKPAKGSGSSGDPGQAHQQNQQHLKNQHKKYVKQISHIVQQQIHAYGKPKNAKQVAALEHFIRTQGSFGDNEVSIVARIVHNLIHGGGGGKKKGGSGHKPPPNAI